MNVRHEDGSSRGSNPLPELAAFKEFVTGRAAIRARPLSQGDVLLGLEAEADIMANAPPGTSGAGRVSNIRLESFTIHDSDLTFATGTELTTGTLRIEKVHDGSLSMDRLKPHVLDPSVTKAFAKDIKWTTPWTSPP